MFSEQEAPQEALQTDQQETVQTRCHAQNQGTGNLVGKDHGGIAIDQKAILNSISQLI